MFRRVDSSDKIDADDPRVSKFGHPAPPWLINYADLMTEIVCFFIILYALSAVLSTYIRKAKKELDRIIQQEHLNAQTLLTKEGVRFTLEEKGATAYFKQGKADLSPEMVYILTKIAPVFKNMPNEMVIEGHTDDIPIHNEQYPSNWELSSARALSVLHALIDEFGVDPGRISAIGYGEYRPCATNNTPENRARNRRVVFFIKTLPPKLVVKDYSALDKKQAQETEAPSTAVPETTPEAKPGATPAAKSAETTQPVTSVPPSTPPVTSTP